MRIRMRPNKLAPCLGAMQTCSGESNISFGLIALCVVLSSNPKTSRRGIWQTINSILTWFMWPWKQLQPEPRKSQLYPFAQLRSAPFDTTKAEADEGHYLHRIYWRIQYIKNTSSAVFELKLFPPGDDVLTTGRHCGRTLGATEFAFQTMRLDNAAMITYQFFVKLLQ